MGPEAKIERKLAAAVKDRGGLCLKWVAPGTVGVPDRICFVPGRVPFFVEVKAPGGRVSDAQERMMAMLRQRGAEVHVVWDETDIERLFI